ncbi:MAG: amidophosphoribosyltransferase, partial [Pseudomonadota bacterium]
VYFASAAPPVRYPNVYGIDMPTSSELIAHGRSEDEVGARIGADRMIYQDLDDLVDAVYYDRTKIDGFDTSCFSGNYVAGDVSDDYLKSLEAERSDEAKRQRDMTFASPRADVASIG